MKNHRYDLLYIKCTYCNVSGACKHCCKHNIISQKMERKSKTRLWLIGKSPPIFHSEGPHGFTCVFPPTGEEVLLQIRAYLSYLDKLSPRKTNPLHAIRLVRQDLEGWWIKTGITVMCPQGIEKKLHKLHGSYKKLKSLMKRQSKKENSIRKSFISHELSAITVIL